jgi:flagellar basal-body rod protein FlgC
MDLFKSMEISASGLAAQRGVMQVISTNLANAHSTRTEEGGPYMRRRAELSASPPSTPFPGLLNRAREKMIGVKMEEVVDESRSPERIHDPGHPDADEDGYVSLPNVNLLEEMTEMMTAVRSYEANVTAFNAAKSMALKALEIGK